MVKENIRYLKENEFLAGWQNLGHQEKALFALLYLSGARVTEALKLKFHAFNFETQTVDLVTLKARKHPIRTVKLLPRDPTIYPYLKDYVLNWKPENGNDYLFYFPDRSAPNSSRVYVWELAKKYFKCTTHSLRHTHATKLVREYTADIFELKNQLGWSNAEPALIYVEYKNQESLEEKINQYLKKGGSI